VKEAWPILKRTFGKFREDNVLGLSAALAYYAMFAIGPLLVIAVGLAGLAFSHEAVRDQTEQQLESIVGENSARTVVCMMSAQKRGAGFVTTIVGLLMLLVGAAGVFGQLQDSLNVIWGVKAQPGLRVWDLIRARLLSLSMVLGIGFLLLVSMILTTFLAALSGSLGSKLGISEALLHILNFVVSLGVVSVLFAMIFKFLPDVKIQLRKVWVGAIGTATLFTIGKSLLALYLGRASTASAYGAAGSVMVVLLWVYYASLILLLGAEFTQVYARQTGTGIGLEKYAVTVSRETVGVEEMPGESGVRGASPGRPSARLAADLH